MFTTDANYVSIILIVSWMSRIQEEHLSRNLSFRKPNTKHIECEAKDSTLQVLFFYASKAKNTITLNTNFSHAQNLITSTCFYQTFFVA